LAFGGNAELAPDSADQAEFGLAADAKCRVLVCGGALRGP